VDTLWTPPRATQALRGVSDEDCSGTEQGCRWSANPIAVESGVVAVEGPCSDEPPSRSKTVERDAGLGSA